MKKVIVTIDTEGHEGTDPVRHLIWGETKRDGMCGVPRIMEECDKVGAKALFFVDFAAAWHFGKDNIAEVVKYIVEHGHDVGVHIHPDHMADPNRMFLFDYSYDEQYEIIKKCTDLYVDILGVKPIAFRAGKYAANHDTLDILAKLGYKADFSEFYGQKWCGINPPVTGDSTVQLKSGLVEVPVISYENHCWKLFHRYDKLDISLSREEHRYVLRQIKNQSYIQNVSMFIHSFSFLNWRTAINNPGFNKRSFKNFCCALKDVRDSDSFEFSSLDTILKEEYPKKEENSEFFSIGGLPALWFYLQKGIKVVKMRIEAKMFNITK